ncbi:DUF2194 domain-containing protein [Paenibacillus montanisoli]|uniref:DUF2194 domain-containing protein n=1 Tax=Paenibacillus montanisoli TaxID=2081970 RepID=A0A328TUI8_9BACL|nr:DUF2194 domain-containing protein [Paenibacillus montanisoli]RAP73980.1 DUF2194 domain-containing protein [Paenibacillus montanisoli]
MEKFNLSRQVYVILSFVFVIALGLQFTRSQSILSIGGKLNAIDHSAEVRDALSAEQVAALNESRTLVLYDSAAATDQSSGLLKANAEQMLRYMKKPYASVQVDSYAGQGEGYQSIIVAFSELSKLHDADWLVKFVEQGGKAMFATTPAIENELYAIYRKLGIDELGDYTQAEGLTFTSNILIQGKGETFGKELVLNTSLQVHLSDKANVHAVDSKGMPILWDMPYGKGKFVVMNGTLLQEKTSRGILTGSINLMQEDDIYPVINTKLMYIDDFPAPIPQGFTQELFDIYQRSVPRFYKEIWWPDMLMLQSRFNLKYTGMIIESYNDNISPPFENARDSDTAGLATFGRELLKRGGEIGIHGYNHQSLTTDHAVSREFGYKSWYTVDDMAASIEGVRAYIQNSFPNYGLHNYVPPSNVLSADGREALKRGWPDLKSISSLYLSDATNLSYIQEFGIASDGIIELPRITSGFIKERFIEWAAMNAASSIGVFSHFVHPDDILDRNRSSAYAWDELFEMLGDFLGMIQDKYGWLRDMTATEGGAATERFSLSEPHFVHKQDGIDGYINRFYEGEELFYILRTEKKITKEKNCSVKRIDENVYLVEVRSEKFSIGLEEA